MDRVSKKRRKKKKHSHWAKATNWKPNQICFIYFCIMVKPKEQLLQGNIAIWPQTCAQTCTKKAHEDKILGSGPDLRGTFSSCISQVLWWKWGKDFVCFLFNHHCFISAFGVLDICWISPTSFSKFCYVPKLQKKWLNDMKNRCRMSAEVSSCVLE